MGLKVLFSQTFDISSNFAFSSSWHILMRMRARKGDACEPIAPLELPHSLHAFHRVSPSDELNVVMKPFLVSRFIDYISIEHCNSRLFATKSN